MVIKPPLYQFRSLSLRELLLFSRAWLLLFGWKLRIKFKLLKIDNLCQHHDNFLLSDSQREQISAMGLAVNRADRYHFFRGSCLTRSLALYSMLRPAGIPVSLQIGVARHNPDALNAHAWLLVGNKVINDFADQVKRYHVMESPPSHIGCDNQ